MLGIVSLMGLFSACDMLEDVYDDPIVEKQEGQYYIDATDYAQWVYINLHTPTPTITTSAIRAFDKGDFDRFLDEFFKAIHSRYDIEKPHIRRYIRRKLGISNSQKQMITDLRVQIDSKNELLKRLAAEYTILGP